MIEYEGHEYTDAYFPVYELDCKLTKKFHPTYPINPVEFITDHYANIVVSPYSEYGSYGKEEFIKYDDRGFTALNGNGKKIIFYNDKKSNECIRFTMFHELGHCLLGHKGNNSVEEKQANVFARNIISPTSIISSRGIDYTSIDTLEKVFGITYDAAIQRKKFYLWDQRYNDYIDDMFQTYADINYSY